MKISVDLTGRKFGKLSVIGVDCKKNGNKYWKCQCECGRITSVRDDSLKSGGSKSCGCPPPSILIGQKVGKLTVIGRASKNKFLCECECGNKTEVFGSNLNRRHTVSCGCYQKEIRGLSSVTHGMTKTDEFNIWQSMKQRCYDKNCKAFAHYGGRGIRICNRWIESFENFILDIGKRPSKQHSIERVNNDGDYELSNCKWATKREQAQNRRYNVKIKYKGEIMTLSEFAYRNNLKGTMVYRHIKTKTPEQILAFYKKM